MLNSVKQYNIIQKIQTSFTSCACTLNCFIAKILCSVGNTVIWSISNFPFVLEFLINKYEIIHEKNGFQLHCTLWIQHYQVKQLTIICFTQGTFSCQSACMTA